VNHLYHLPGVTDGAVQRAQAEKHAARGQTSWVHEHARLEECNDKCELFEPAPISKKEQEDEATQA